jgi:hypothetical protein
VTAGTGPAAAMAARQVLAAVAWADEPPPPVDDATLAAAVVLARRNQVEGRLAGAYPDRLAGELARVREATAAFRRNLGQAAGRLRAAGVTPVLIKADPAEAYVYTNFDLVVGDDGWPAAVAALAPWGARSSAYWLERDKLLVHPTGGPAAHLHRSVAWFEVPVVPTERLRARALPSGDGAWWLPAPVDALRITCAHALFQNLAFDLSELRSLRRQLADDDLVAAARAEAAAEGWRRGFEAAVTTAAQAIARLDRGWAVGLPVPLEVPASLAAGLEHAAHLAAHGRLGVAGRELALRGPLVAAKRRRHGGR